MAARTYRPFQLDDLRGEYYYMEQAYVHARKGYERELAESRNSWEDDEYRAAALVRLAGSRAVLVAMDNRLKTLEAQLPSTYTVARPPLDLPEE